MPPYSDGNLTAWKDRRRIVLSHSTKYGKKSFLGLKKAPRWISRALLSSPQLPVGPAVHMLMSQSLIVSSYFNLLHGVGGEGRRGDDGGGGADRRSVSTRKRWDERESDGGPGKRREGRGCGQLRIREEEEEEKDKQRKLCRGRRKSRMFDWNSEEMRGWERAGWYY